MSAPIEVTTRYATSVDTLAEAWAFVMAHIDTLGEAPSVDIKPTWRISARDPDNEAVLFFQVVVSGMQEQAGGAE